MVTTRRRADRFNSDCQMLDGYELLGGGDNVWFRELKVQQGWIRQLLHIHLPLVFFEELSTPFDVNHAILGGNLFDISCAHRVHRLWD